VYWLRNSGISYSGDYPTSPLDGLPYSKYNYLFGATVTYNLFDLKHRRNEMAEGSLGAQAKQNALQTQQVTLNSMLQQANSTYATTILKLNEIPVELASARQAYGQQLALYRSGLNTLIDVTNAQYVLLQAETNYVIMQDQLLQVLYIRAGLGGQLDEFLQNFKR
jgi:outer membrane protein TolC